MTAGSLRNEHRVRDLFVCSRVRCARVVPGVFDVVYVYRGTATGPQLLCGSCVELLRETPGCAVELVGVRGEPLELRVLPGGVPAARRAADLRAGGRHAIGAHAR